MRKTVIAVVLASFIGVFGALEADHLLVRGGKSPAVSSSTPDTSRLFPVSYAPGVAAAPFDFSAAAKRVSGSVVSVDQYSDVPDMMGDSMGIQKTGTGSGVVISDSGLIVTNNHVVAGAKRVVVRTNDNKSYDAKVLGTDSRADLAVIQVPAKDLQPIETGSNSDLAVGQWVMAVGNPLNLGDTVTVGVISSLGRDLPIGERGMVGAIQTDASINPGNSGGALCDSQGRLIGINAAIESGTGQSIGIGFAIPVDRVKSVVSDIIKFGYVKYAGLGITYNPRWDGILASDQMRTQLGEYIHVSDLPNHGVVVIDATGGAAQAGIAKYDVIEAIDGQRIDSNLDLNKATILKKPGETIKVTLWSHGKTVVKSIVLQELPKPLAGQ